MNFHVTEEGETFTAECECGFQSYGWPTEEDAAARGEQHSTEHDTKQPMPAVGEAR